MDKLETPSKKRKTKTTLAQYELYVEMLETNPYFRENKITPTHPNDVADCWDKLVENLNASGGPQKTLPEWKRVFTDWKSQVRKRARLMKNILKETGNKGEPEKDLPELEKKLLYLTGNVVVEGVSGVPEIGVENQENIEKALEEQKKEETDKAAQKTMVTKKSCDRNILTEINANLEKLVELKKQELELKYIKYKLKYNVEVQSGDENE